MVSKKALNRFIKCLSFYEDEDFCIEFYGEDLPDDVIDRNVQCFRRCKCLEDTMEVVGKNKEDDEWCKKNCKCKSLDELK